MRANWGEDQIELRVGNETALTNAVYAQIQKGKPEVGVISRDLVDKLARSHQAWRDHQVLDFEPARVTKVILRDTMQEIELQKNKKGWDIMRPLYARASDQEMQNLLQTLRNLRVKNFVAEDNSNNLLQGLNDPAVRVQLFYDDKKERVAALQLGKNDPDDPNAVFAKQGGGKSVFTIETNGLEALNLSTENYRDRKLARFAPEAVSQIKIYHQDALFQQAIETNGTWQWSDMVASWHLANDQAIQRF
ncbi:MAG: DUF4340 domain-containing protein [Verrucomicrobiia bacterium]